MGRITETHYAIVGVTMAMVYVAEVATVYVAEEKTIDGRRKAKFI